MQSNNKLWDKPVIDKICSILHASQPDDHNRTRLLAAPAAHSGDWLQVLLISFSGLRLDDEAVRVAAGFRLGTNICDQQRYPCGTVVACRGTHKLSCKKSSARISKHSYINDSIYYALARAKIASVKEPGGLSRTDGKRPDSLTLIPWQVGKNLVWNVTVANSYLTSTSVTASSAAELATSRKEVNYVDMTTTHIFLHLAVESFCSLCSKALAFLK